MSIPAQPPTLLTMIDEKESLLKEMATQLAKYNLELS